MIAFYAGEVLEKTSMCLTAEAASGNKITSCKMSPLMQSMWLRASLRICSASVVIATLSSLMSFQEIFSWPSTSVANKEGPLPKASSYPMKAAVKALSPVIILTSWDDSLSS